MIFLFFYRQCLGGFQDKKNYEQFQWITQCFVLLMTNLLKSYKGQDQIIYPARNEEDAESSDKLDNILANFKDEGKYLFIYFNIKFHDLSTKS